MPKLPHDRRAVARVVCSDCFLGSFWNQGGEGMRGNLITGGAY